MIKKIKLPDYAVFLFILSCLFLPSLTYAASMGDYCVVPPYAKTQTPVNVFVIMDNSRQMLGQAFTTAYSSGGNYIGYFDTEGCYTYSTVHNNYWYRTSNATNHTCSNAGEFPGHLLNWATMSRLEVLKRVLVGGNLSPQVSYSPTSITAEGSGWGPVSYNGCNYTTLNQGGNLVVTTSGTCPATLSNARLNIYINYTCAGRINNACEAVSGVLQDLLDTNHDLNADSNSPRLGLIMWQQATSADPATALCIPFSQSSSSLQNNLNQIAQGQTVNDSPLANAEKLAIKELIHTSTAADGTTGVTDCPNLDPYVTCAQWETSCSASSPHRCRKSFILILSSGCDVGYTNGTTRANDDCAGTQTGTTATDYFPFNATCATDAQFPNTSTQPLVKDACFGSTTDLRSDIGGNQYAYTYVVQTFGSGTNRDLLKATAAAGQGIWYDAGEEDIDAAIRQAFQDILKRAASGTAASVLASGEGSGANLVQAVFYPQTPTLLKGGIFDTSIQWIGRLQNLWYYVDPLFAASGIKDDYSGGTPDKILDLSNDRTVVTNYVAYPNTVTIGGRTFSDVTVANLYNPNGSLNSTVLLENIVNLWEAGVMLWNRDLSSYPRTIYTSCLSGSCPNNLMDFSTSNAANATLQADLQASDTTDATNIINYVSGYDNFCTGTTTACTQDSDCWTLPGLSACTGCCIINRTRVTGIDLNGNGNTSDSAVSINGITMSESPKVWKLGDILDSTPKISSWMPLGGYHKAYNDGTYGPPGADPNLEDPVNANQFITTTAYKRRGMVFTGSNDGMLHAFKLGTLGLKWDSRTSSQYATLGRHCSTNETYRPCVTSSDCSAHGDGSCVSDSDYLGKEMWAFIPKNALPYLKYAADQGYCHIYSVDFTPYIFDASINIDEAASGQPADCTDANNSVSGFDYWKCVRSSNSWKTILIGGMRYGGACRNQGTSCTDCVKTPISGIGYSEYFALDVTDQNNPKLLWEFSDPTLGFTTTGPSIVRIGARTLSGTGSTADGAPGTKNGRWFVVFGSGPTGPIDTTTQQFLARSDQNLRVFVFDVKNGPGTNNADVKTFVLDGAGGNPSVPTAFAGSLINANLDVAPQDYQDDVIYVPYVRKCTSSEASTGTFCSDSTKWTNGGVLRLLTNATSLNGADISATGNTALNPNNWTISTVIDGIGPVSAAVQKLQDINKNLLWLYFGTGRYFFTEQGGGAAVDDASDQRMLFGIVEPCFVSGALSSGCTTSRSYSSLSNVPLTSTAGVNTTSGWHINLDMCTDSSGNQVSCTASNVYYRTERVITDPVATTSGVVFFTTYKPYDDQCSLGGISNIWAVKYDTAAAPGAMLKGKAIIQVSTGSIQEVDLRSQFLQDAAHKYGRRSGMMEGVPPINQGLSLLSSPPPVKRVIHMREK